MTSSFHERAMKAYQDEVARGEHDARCEFPACPYLCHCSKRRREAAGYTTPPGDLIWQQPICPRCDEEVSSDGDSFTCEACCASWNKHGEKAEFFDDYGDGLDSGPTRPQLLNPPMVDVHLPDPTEAVAG
jgi:hypothetical protein